MPRFELLPGSRLVVESSARASRFLTSGLLSCLVLAAGLACALWLIPIEFFQAWAVDRAGRDDFEKFEAYGTATAAVWFLRWACGIAATGFALVWICRETALPFLNRAVDEFWRVIASAADQQSTRSSGSIIRTRTIQLLVMSWLVLGVYQFGCGINRRLKDWPVYQLNPGSQTLPNISDSNRDVVRYLVAATDPNARILVLSDQKLYFLSYYLLPRRLYHPTHPDSEFVIAKPHNERQMASYRLQDLTPEQIEQVHPDYILEYFEGKPFIENEDLSRDAGWVNYQRQRRGPQWQPSFLVSLRRYSAGDAR